VLYKSALAPAVRSGSFVHQSRRPSHCRYLPHLPASRAGAL